MKQVKITVAIFVTLCVCLPSKSWSADKKEINPQKELEIQVSGLLGDYSHFHPDPVKPSTLIYRSDKHNLGEYEKLIFDPILVFFSPQAEYKGIQPDELKKLTDYFRTAIVKAIQDVYPITDKPGPGVLRLRAAITDLAPTKPVLATVTTISPFALVTTGIVEHFKGAPPFYAQVQIEAELIDSQTGERVVGYVSRKAGQKDPVKAVSKWKDVEGAFDYWANDLKEALVKAKQAKE
jgi:hypothetical protein